MNFKDYKSIERGNDLQLLLQENAESISSTE